MQWKCFWNLLPENVLRTSFCGGWGTKGIAFLYSIYCILIVSYVKLLFYDLTDYISNSNDSTLDVGSLDVEPTLI